MYKKIMFLIITLSIIINVGNSTVVMAKENIVTEIVDFPVTINYEEYNVDDYNANDMMLCEYPMVVYKNMTYIPLTYYNCILLGLEVQFDKNILSVEKRDSEKPTEYLRDQSSEKNTKNIIKTNYLVIPGQKRSRCRSNRGIIDSPTPLFTPFCRFRYRSRGQIHSHQYPRTSSTNDPFLKWFSYASRMTRIAMSTSPF